MSSSRALDEILGSDAQHATMTSGDSKLSPSDRSQAHILIVDDDEELVHMLCEYLRRDGFTVESCHDAEQAIPHLASTSTDLVILDVMLPGRSGLDLLRQLVPQYPTVGFIMLTARGDAVDRIVGLELGADDYLPKPFDPRELSARIRAVLRRRDPSGGTPDRSMQSVFGCLNLDLAHKQARVHDQTLSLTTAEFRVLHRLIQTPGEAVARSTLTEYALGRMLTLYDRSIDTHVSNLRRKLEQAGAKDIRIQSVRGSGYEIMKQLS